MKQQRKAFTLIELLVVVSIISILAAILFPVFARARENARRSSCMSNEKQIGLGLLQYTQDYDDRLPIYHADKDVWTNHVQPYIKSWQLFRCPSSPTAKRNIASKTPGHFYQTNYALNGYSGCGLYTSTGRMLSSYDTPSVTWMLVELGHPTYYYSDGYGFAYSTLCGTGTSTPDGYSNFMEPHLEGQNIAYLDGHVKWRKSGEDTTGQNWKASPSFFP